MNILAKALWAAQRSCSGLNATTLRPDGWHLEQDAEDPDCWLLWNPDRTIANVFRYEDHQTCLLYTSPSPRD